MGLFLEGYQGESLIIQKMRRHVWSNIKEIVLQNVLLFLLSFKQ